MGRTAALLGERRVLAGTGLLAALVAYYALFRYGPNLPTAWDVLFVGFVLIPAVFALVWIALPLRRARGLSAVGVGFAVLAVVASGADLDVLANFAKLFAATALAFWFLSFFENALWVALVALLIPFVDAYSVWRGPTRHIIDERPEVFGALSFAFPLVGERQVFVVWKPPLAGSDETRYDLFRTPPGEKRNDEPIFDANDDGEVGWLEAELDAHTDYRYTIRARGPTAGEATVESRADEVNEGEHRAVTPSRFAPTDVRVESVDSSAKLGLPDLLFFALFLAATDAFRLRRGATWLLMTLSFGFTLAGTYFFAVDGLPALPLLAIAFLLANADLLWRKWRERKGDGESAGGAPPP